VTLANAEQREERILSGNCERPIEHREADYFRPGNMRSVTLAFGGEEERARCEGRARFFPVARKDVSVLVREGMGVRRHGYAGVEFAEHDNSTCGLVFVQNLQFNARIRPKLPRLFVGERDILEHVVD